MFRLSKIILISTSLLFLASGCSQTTRLGMIKDPTTGIQYGSTIGESFFIDSQQFANNVLKVSTRNVSGDIHYDLKSFTNQLKSAFKEKGYNTDTDQDFGVKVDVVIEYSGHVQTNMSNSFAFLGAATAGYYGSRYSSAKDAEKIGIVTGAMLGSIAGSYQTEDTYIVIAKVNIGILDSKSGRVTRTISFSSSPKLQEEEKDGLRRFKEVVSTDIAVYAGGRNVEQSEVVNEVKKRLIRIVSDII